MSQAFSVGWIYLLIIVLAISLARIWLKVRTIQRGDSQGGPVIKVAPITRPEGRTETKNQALAFLAVPDDLIRKGEHSEALKQLDRALEEFSPTEDRENRGRALLRVGACHGHLARGVDRSQHLLKAGEALGEAVRLFSPDRYRDLYLKALGELATHYTDLAGQRNPVENLTQAARTLETAADSACRGGLVKSEAMFYMRSGDLYRQLAYLGEPAINLRKAVMAYEKAADLLEKAGGRDRTSGKILILKLLGDACEDLAEYSQGAGNLGKALNAYQAALQSMDTSLHSREQMVIMTDIGRVRLKLFDSGGDREHLKQALHFTRDALKGPGTGKDPEPKGMAMAVFADALTRYAEIKDRKENLARAVKLYTAALENLKHSDSSKERDRIREELDRTVEKLDH